MTDILKPQSQARHMAQDKCKWHTGMGAKMQAMLKLVCCIFQSFFKYSGTKSVPNNNFGSSKKRAKANHNNNGEGTNNESLSQSKFYKNMKTYIIVSVSALETMNLGKDAAGERTKLHRKIVCKTNDNQSFAFHVWGNLAKVFMGKPGDTIICDYTSKVHVSRTGVYHTNLNLVNYAIVHRAAHDDLEVIQPNNKKPNCEIGTKGIDYPDFDDETIDYQYNLTSNSAAVYDNNKENNYGER